MRISLLLPILGILLGGVFLSAQAPINAALARALGDPVLAACISFGIGFVVLELFPLAWNQLSSWIRRIF